MFSQIWDRLIRFEDESGLERYGEPVDKVMDGRSPLLRWRQHISANASYTVGMAMYLGKKVFARIIQTDSALNPLATFSGEKVK